MINESSRAVKNSHKSLKKLSTYKEPLKRITKTDKIKHNFQEIGKDINPKHGLDKETIDLLQKEYHYILNQFLQNEKTEKFQYFWE